MTSTSGGTFPNSNETTSIGPINEGRVAELSCRLRISTNEFASSEVKLSQSRSTLMIPIEQRLNQKYNWVEAR